MDYTAQNLSFKIRKALRYVRLYGVRRTLVKGRSQYHLRRRFDVMPRLASSSAQAHVGLIGCGAFAFAIESYYLNKNYGRVIRGVMDINIHRAASLASSFKAGYYTDNADELLGDPNIDLVFVASNHASHADYAIKALHAGKAVHIEKPHAVNDDQLVRLCRAIKDTNGKVTLGFCRPDSVLGSMLHDYLAREPGTAMFNWFVVGHKLAPGHWYMNPEEGGRVPGNLCHWIDAVYHLVPPDARYPITIYPMVADEADSDIIVAYTFGDGTSAAITFSVKGHTFEGVRETFSAQKGDLLATLIDFKTLRLDVGDKVVKRTLWWRDHGHERKIRRSYSMVRPKGATFPGMPLSYIWEIGDLVLKTRDALEQRRRIVVEPFSDDMLR